jgi:uncharacterized protein (DUF1697 family)
MPATALVALLRAVNVGGTGMLPMADLAALCTGLGFADVRTYIQSGNVVFRTALAPEKARAALAKALSTHMGRPVDVMVRDAAALRRTLAANPFPDAEPAKVVVLFCAEPVPKGLVDGLRGPDGEVVVAARDEVYIHYVQGQGRTKLKLPKALGVGTARNVNTVAKLAAMAEAPAAVTRPAAPRPAAAKAPRRTARPGARRAPR